MNLVASVCRCALVVVVVSSLPLVSLAQTGRGMESAENPFGPAPGREDAAVTEDTAIATSEPPSFCHCIGETNSESVARINKALSRPLKQGGLQFVDEPLESAMNVLQDDYDLSIQIDVKALDDVGLSTNEPITINVNGVSLKSALRLMLRPLHLTYIIVNEVLIITTPDEAETRLAVCVYDVRDLVNARNATKELEKLVGVVTACVATETWAANGGREAEIRALPPGLLVVSQTRAVHEEISGLFAAMRKILAAAPPGPSQARAMRGLRRGESFIGRGYEGYGGEYGGRGGYAPQEAE